MPCCVIMGWRVNILNLEEYSESKTMDALKFIFLKNGCDWVSKQTIIKHSDYQNYGPYYNRFLEYDDQHAACRINKLSEVWLRFIKIIPES